MREPYPSDLTDEEWELLEPLLPPPSWTGRKREVDLREVLNAIFYQLRTGCQWEYLPHDFPAPGTVYWWFRKFEREGTWEKIHQELYTTTRASLGRHDEPSAAILDSQSVKTTEKRGLADTTVARKSTVENAIW